jgi:uncharacterized protein
MTTRYPIPRDALLYDRLGWVGTAGSGKTYNAGSAIERVLKAGARAVIPDPLGVWWGLRLNAAGDAASPFNVVIFGGPHGDLPLSEHAGALIGETVAGIAESCIIDLSELGTKAAERRFMFGFLTSLNRHATREPLHLVFDEADMWAPQQLRDKEGEAAKLLGMMETIVRRGRIKGFIPWLITQRPAVLNKDVLSQVDGLVNFKLTSSQDRNAIGGWVEGQADKALWDEIWSALPAMQRGEGFVWIPGRGLLERATFPLKTTFDSSKTPERGERRQALELKPLDVEKLKGRLAKVEAEVKANDPSALKRQVAELQRQLAAAQQQKPAAAQAAGGGITERQLKSAVAAANRDGFGNGVAMARGVVGEFLARALAPIADELKGLPLKTAGAPGLSRLKPPAPDAPLVSPAVPPASDKGAGASVTHHRSGNGQVDFKKLNTAVPIGGFARETGLEVSPARQKILNGLALLESIGIAPADKTQLALFIKVSPTSGGYFNNLGALRSAGLIEYPQGGTVALTDEGRAAAAAPDTPPTTADLHAMIAGLLPAAKWKLLERLIDIYPESISKDELAARAGVSPTSGGYFNNLGSLRSLGLIEYPSGGQVVAKPILFLEGG